MVVFLSFQCILIGLEVINCVSVLYKVPTFCFTCIFIYHAYFGMYTFLCLLQIRSLRTFKNQAFYFGLNIAGRLVMKTRFFAALATNRSLDSLKEHFGTLSMKLPRVCTGHGVGYWSIHSWWIQVNLTPFHSFSCSIEANNQTNTLSLHDRSTLSFVHFFSTTFFVAGMLVIKKGIVKHFVFANTMM